MTTTILNQAKALQDSIDLITSQQALAATTGAKAVVIVVDADNNQLLGADALVSSLGSSAFNAIAATALTSITSGLTSTKTTKQTALTAL